MNRQREIMRGEENKWKQLERRGYAYTKTYKKMYIWIFEYQYQASSKIINFIFDSREEIKHK